MQHPLHQKKSELPPFKKRQVPTFKSGKSSLWWMPALIFFALNVLLAQAQIFTEAKEIRLQINEVRQLFTSKKGDKTRLLLSVNEKSQQVELQVLNHLNPGEKSGALALRFLMENEEAKLLINRKVKNGKLVYWLAILPAQGTQGYKLETETGNEFVLVKVNKNLIVSE
jgi:hypothetical protein